MEQLKSILNNCQKMGEFWSVREYKEVSTFRMARNGKNHENSTGISHGVMVEVMEGGAIGYCATSNMTVSGLNQAFKNAYNQALKAAKCLLYKFDYKEIRPSHEGVYHGGGQKGLKDIVAGEQQNILMNASKLLSDKEFVVDASAYFFGVETNINYLSSTGANIQQSFGLLNLDYGATGVANGVTQRRNLGLRGGQQGMENLQNYDFSSDCQRIHKELDELLNAPECPSDSRDLIITPSQLYLQVHESIGHPLELDRILGDERNYAGWSFVSPDDFGTLKYGPEILNVTFDPTLKGEMASYDYDDTGVAAKKEYLIEKGVLKRAIGGIESQNRSGIDGVSCSRSSSWNRPPMDRMGNINIEPGDSTLEEMISSTERGILMDTNRSWSIDDYRNKFQFGCEYARVIEDGELKGVVKNPNYRSSTVPFWNSLSHVGDRSTYEVWGSPYCGKGEPNQIIRVGHAIPTCKFKNIEVFGGVK